MEWRTKEAELKSFERQRRLRGKKISHCLGTNGFLPLCCGKVRSVFTSTISITEQALQEERRNADVHRDV